MLTETYEHEEIVERVAALDIGKAELMCCARIPDPDRPGMAAGSLPEVVRLIAYTTHSPTLWCNPRRLPPPTRRRARQPLQSRTVLTP
jgi:hypothetical protein